MVINVIPLLKWVLEIGKLLFPPTQWNYYLPLEVEHWEDTLSNPHVALNIRFDI